MDSKDLVQKYGFITVGEWVKVDQFVMGNASGSDIQRQLPKGVVVCAMRYRGDPDDLAAIGQGLLSGKSDILYLGYSSKLGTRQADRLYNMRHNHQSTDQNIRDGMAKVYDALPERVEIGWRLCVDEVEARRLSSELRKRFYDEHGEPPPWNRR